MTKEQQEERFKYLVELRDSCVTNMFGARPYLQRKFLLTQKEAEETLLAWMESFDE